MLFFIILPLVDGWSHHGNWMQYWAGECNYTNTSKKVMEATDDEGRDMECKALTLLNGGDACNWAEGDENGTHAGTCYWYSCGDFIAGSFWMNGLDAAGLLHAWSLVMPPWSLVANSDIGGYWNYPNCAFRGNIQADAEDNANGAGYCKSVALYYAIDTFGASPLDGSCFYYTCSNFTNFMDVGMTSSSNRNYMTYSQVVPPWSLISSGGNYILGDCVDIPGNGDGDGIEMTAADDDGKVAECKAATLLLKGDSCDVASNNKCYAVYCGARKNLGMKESSEAGHP